MQSVANGIHNGRESCKLAESQQTSISGSAEKGSCHLRQPTELQLKLCGRLLKILGQYCNVQRCRALSRASCQLAWYHSPHVVTYCTSVWQPGENLV